MTTRSACDVVEGDPDRAAARFVGKGLVVAAGVAVMAGHHGAIEAIRLDIGRLGSGQIEH